MFIIIIVVVFVVFLEGPVT